MLILDEFSSNSARRLSRANDFHDIIYRGGGGFVFIVSINGKLARKKTAREKKKRTKGKREGHVRLDSPLNRI